MSNRSPNPGGKKPGTAGLKSGKRKKVVPAGADQPNHADDRFKNATPVIEQPDVDLVAIPPEKDAKD